MGNDNWVDAMSADDLPTDDVIGVAVAGREVAVNGMNNLKLFDGVPQDAVRQGAPLTAKQASLAAKHRTGPVELGELESMIRAFVGSAP